MAASISAKVLDIKKEDIREGLKDFKGVEHRLEKVARVRGVEFINDSKATNVNSCWYALESMRTKVILILGGKDKGNDYSEIEDLVKEKVNAIICLGVDNSKLHAFFEGKVPHIEDASSMKEAVDKGGWSPPPASSCGPRRCCSPCTGCRTGPRPRYPLRQRSSAS